MTQGRATQTVPLPANQVGAQGVAFDVSQDCVKVLVGFPVIRHQTIRQQARGKFLHRPGPCGRFDLKSSEKKQKAHDSGHKGLGYWFRRFKD